MASSKARAYSDGRMGLRIRGTIQMIRKTALGNMLTGRAKPSKATGRRVSDMAKEL